VILRFKLPEPLLNNGQQDSRDFPLITFIR